METGNPPLPCNVIKTHSNKVYFAVNLDLLCSVGGFFASIFWIIYMDRLSWAPIWFTIRGSVAAIVLVGNMEENVWGLCVGGVVGQTCLIIWGYLVLSLQILIPFGALSMLLSTFAGLRIKEILTNSSPNTTTA